jgi:Gamma tubulin complex component N-terminal
LFETKDLQTQLFSISSLLLGGVDENPAASEATSEGASEISIQLVEDEEDTWEIWKEEATEVIEQRHAWEGFLYGEKEPRTVYISECGPAVFDAALELHTSDIYEPGACGVAINPDLYRSCIFNLGLGRSSLLFQYDDTDQRFRPTRDNFRIPGCSLDTVRGFTRRFSECGSAIAKLQTFVDKIYRSSRSLPTMIALADATSTILSTLQARLGDIPFSSSTFLQLQAQFEHPHTILECFVAVVECTVDASSDDDILSRLYLTLEQLEYKNTWLRDILLEILSKVSRPWLEFVAGWMGLGKEGMDFRMNRRQGSNSRFVSVVENSITDERGVEVVEAQYVSNPDLCW